MIERLRRRYARLVADRDFSEILTGSVFALGAQVTATLLGMAASILVARGFGATSVGMVAMVDSFLTLVAIFTVLGTNTSILRLIPEHVAKYSASSAFRVYRKTELVVAMVSVLTGAILFLTAPYLAGVVFSKPHLTPLFALAAGFVVFRSLMPLNTSAIRGLKLIKTFALMQVLPSLAMLLGLIGLSFLGSDPKYPVYAQLGAFGVAAVVGTVVMDRAFHRVMSPTDVVSSVSIRNIAELSLPMLMTSSMQFFIGQIGVMILGALRSEAEVGYFSVAVRLATLTSFFLRAVTSMAAPKFSELYYSGRVDDLLSVARRSTRLIFWSSAPVLLGLTLLGRPVLHLLYGRDFTVAYWALVMLVLGQFVNAIAGSNSAFMNMTGHHKAFRNIILGATVLNLALNVTLIPSLGINGAALAGMATFVFWNAATQVFITRVFGTGIGYLPIPRWFGRVTRRK